MNKPENKKFDRAKKAEEIKANHKKIKELEAKMALEKARKKEAEKKLKEDVKELVNSYPSKKQGKTAIKKIKSSIKADLSKVS